MPTGCLNIEKLRSRRAPNWTRASCTSLRSTPTTDPPFVNTVAKCSSASTIRATDARTQTVGSMSMKTVERFANIFSSSNNFSLIQLCTIACGVDFTKFIKVVENLKKKEAKKFDENEVHEQGIEEYKKRAPKLTKENSIKIDLSGFTLKTTLGRGGYGKVRMCFAIPLISGCRRWSWGKENQTNSFAPSSLWVRRRFWVRIALTSACSKERFWPWALSAGAKLANLKVDSQRRFLTNMLASFQTTERLFFVMEFVSGGDLFHHIVEVQVYLLVWHGRLQKK